MSCVVWLTGVPAVGKTTVGSILLQKLAEQKILAHLLDGDALRKGISSNLGLSDQDRTEQARRTAEIAKIVVEIGCVAIVCLISPYRADRARAKEICQKAGIQFLEILVTASFETRMARDPKGLYADYYGGKIKGLTGLDAPYEEPLNPDLVLNTDELSEAQSAQKIINLLQNYGVPLLTNVKPVFLHHIMKTAGRAIQVSVYDACSKLCNHHWSGQEIYGKANFMIGPWKFGGYYDSSPIHSSHYPKWQYNQNRSQITVLRHPLERLISLLRMFEIEHPNHPWWHIFSENVAPEPVDFIDKVPDSIVCNDVYIFSKSIDPVEAAQEILKLDLVVWQDRFQEGLDALSKLMNLSLPNIPFGMGYNENLTRESLLSNSVFIKRAIERLEPSFKLMRLLGRPDLTFPRFWIKIPPDGY